MEDFKNSGNLGICLFCRMSRWVLRSRLKIINSRSFSTTFDSSPTVSSYPLHWERKEHGILKNANIWSYPIGLLNSFESFLHCISHSQQLETSSRDRLNSLQSVDRHLLHMLYTFYDFPQNKYLGGMTNMCSIDS
jgi:hypothetical protein